MRTEIFWDVLITLATVAEALVLAFSSISSACTLYLRATLLATTMPSLYTDPI